MVGKLFASLCWVGVAGLWVGAATFLISLSNWGDGAASSFYTKARYIREGFFLLVPLVIPIMAIFSPYEWFPKKTMWFARFPYSLLFFILGIVLGLFLPMLVPHGLR